MQGTDGFLSFVRSFFALRGEKRPHHKLKYLAAELPELDEGQAKKL
jgi:hypothetical protein